MTQWRGTRAAGLERLTSFVDYSGSEYTRFRNYDLGRGRHEHVSRLSPWISCRLVLELEVAQIVIQQQGLDGSEKFIQEVFWRTYWKGWLEQRPEVWRLYCRQRDLHFADVDVNDDLRHRYSAAVSAESGIDCFDEWVTELKDTGYLHNHARMWFASIWIFTLKLPWETGADFFLRHLLDGDAASNTLSWRWVAGLQTQNKHYLARAENIAKFTRERHMPSGLSEAAPALTYQSPPEPQTIVDGSAGGVTSIDFKNSGLLVTNDDLQPESLFEIEKFSAVMILNCATDRSAGPIGLPLRQFLLEAIEDTEMRIKKRCSAIETAQTSPQHHESMGTDERSAKDIRAEMFPIKADYCVSQVVDWATRNNLRQVFCAHINAGPTRDQLLGLSAALKSHGIHLHAIQRDWDKNAWPFATKGFFAFKKKIPFLLQQSNIL